MLSFMRKHQKYFYAVITVVIIMSFSFFGTYGTLDGNSFHEQLAFTTVKGEDISRGELEEMAAFISTDSHDKLLFGGAWGPNFLNDGVIRIDLLNSGLASVLVAHFPDAVATDLKSRFAKEVRYKPYTHPQAPYLSSITTWSYFVPEIPQQLAILQKASDPLAPEAFEARTQLFMNERRFPSFYLAQVLKQQEKQNRSIAHDPVLDREDLSIFGYHTIEDWFGPRFVRLMAEFIFNAASIAEAQGYRVTKEEALADLYKNAEVSFKENANSPSRTSLSSSDYLEQQLMRMHLDKTKATKIWQKVLLFRRLFNDVSSSVFVDLFAYKGFNSFSNEAVSINLYRLPQPLQINDFPQLVRLEAYLNAIAKRSKEERNALALPTQFLATAEVAKKYPELVRKRYTLEISSINKKDLQARVGVKEALAWSIAEEHWAALKTAFPELGMKKAATKEERLAALDGLDPTTRFRLEQFARAAIVDAHPEWIAEALDKAQPKTEQVSLSLKGENSTFKGLDKGETLIQKLDAQDLISSLSFNNENFYRIKVLSKTADQELLSFGEAVQNGVLDSIADQALELHYVEVRGQNPADYQKADKSWKSLAEVRNQVAVSYHSKLLAAIKDTLNSRSDAERYKALEGDRLAPYRFTALVTEVNAQLQKNPANKAQWVINADQLKEVPSNADQFKLIEEDVTLSRANSEALADGAALFALPAKSYSKVTTSPNGDLYFAYVQEKTEAPIPQEAKNEQIARSRFLLGSSAERAYLEGLIPALKADNAISFDYLMNGDPQIEPES